MSIPVARCWSRAALPLAVFAAVAGVQLWLVAGAGTDVPFQDQWDVEGRWLYPGFAAGGALHFSDLLRPHNEHRILWTHLLNLGLFKADGQWDPLVQLIAGAGLRAAAAAGLAWLLGCNLGSVGRWVAAAGVVAAYLPILAWHNALWGFQSQVYFVLLFALGTLELLAEPEPTFRRQCGGLAVGCAGLLAMGPGALIPGALLGLALLRGIGRRSWGQAGWREAWPALVLLALALSLRVQVPELAELRPASVGEFVGALGRMLAWPHVDQPMAALVLNLPLALVAIRRLAGKPGLAPGEDLVLLLGGWAVGVALAAAWSRGGSAEFAAGVPSRYVDLIVLLPLANAWSVLALVSGAMGPSRQVTRLVAFAWGGFLLIGWIGLSAQMWRGVVGPRLRDREAPVRLVQAFQATGDPAVFAGQPRLLVPHPNPESVRVVLADPRMKGLLPPSFQPSQPMGPLSRAARWLVGW